MSYKASPFITKKKQKKQKKYRKSVNPGKRGFISM